LKSEWLNLVSSNVIKKFWMFAFRLA